MGRVIIGVTWVFARSEEFLLMRCLAVASLVVGIAWGTALARGEDLRTWKDVSGKFSIRARFVAVDNGVVTLQREGGDEVEIALDKLTPADRTYIADRPAADDPFKPAAPKDPFKTKGKDLGRDKPRGAAPSAAAAAVAPDPVTPDWSAARAVAPAPSSNDWKVVVPAVSAAAPDGTATKPRPIGLPPKANFFERLKGVVASADGKMALVGYSMDDPRPLGVTRIVECDLARGKPLGVASVPGQFVPLALSDDGSQALMRRAEFGFGNNDRVEFWALSPSGVKRERALVPYGDVQGNDRDVKWGAFLKGDQFATVSNVGKLVIWGLDDLAPHYYLTIQNGCIPALSPDRSLLAFTTGKEVGILDVAQGEVLALQATPNTPFPALAFSASGRKLALVAFDKLWVYDLATGTMQREIVLNGLHTNGQIQFTSEDHALVGGRYLIDLENQVRLWDYAGAEGVTSVGPVALFAVAPPNGVGALVPATLPHAGALATLKTAMAAPDFFAVKPGLAVRVDVNGITDPAQRDKVAADLAAALRKIDVQVNASAPVTLAATTELGQEREVSYRTFGRLGMQTYKVREYISRVRILAGGKSAWEAASYNIPHIAMLKEGQTMADYLKGQEKHNYNFFSHVEVPRFVTRPTGGVTLGTSQVTASGIR